jgi:hypothetical protein
MAYSITASMLPTNSTQLVAELEALAIPGVRTYSVFGASSEEVGVYPWSDLAPVGEYRHVDDTGYEVAISPASVQAIRDVILAHVPI